MSCESAGSWLVELIILSGQAVSAGLVLWLARMRRRTDHERREFQSSVCRKLDLPVPVLRATKKR